MRRLCLLALLCAPAAAAGEESADVLALRRLAMEAHLRIAETLLRQGEVVAARHAYEDALAVVQERRTSPAVELALTWLAKHQDESGLWDCDEFFKHDPADDRCDGPGGRLYDVGVTGLALCAFLGAGYTDRGNPHAETVRKGLEALQGTQDVNGVFGTRATHSFMYQTAIATLALCEAVNLTHNPKYKQAAKKGIDFLVMARNPFMAWRYEPRGGENDTSVTGWCVCALKAGARAGLEIDPGAFEGARAWVDKMTEPNFGKTGYNFPGGTSARPQGLQDAFPSERSEAMTAEAIWMRVTCGEDPRKSELIQKGTQLCLELRPEWNVQAGSIDMYFWYYGTLAMMQVGPRECRKWNEALENALLPNQHQKGARRGSWDPVGPWGRDGGRVYSTALMAMALQVAQRGDGMARRPRRDGPR